MAKFVDLTGKKFGKLTAQWPTGKEKNGGIYWLCLCECGRFSYVRSKSLLSDTTSSCGCLRITHGKTGQVECNLFDAAKHRAKHKNIPFEISVSDISVPEKCPLLGIALKKGNRRFKDSSPSLDRIIPEKGYIKGNICVISYRANVIKNNATLDELKTIVKNWEKLK